MKCICSFNPERDIRATVPDMAIDLAGAIESGVVLDTGMIAEHNDIDSPASIVGRVHDIFDAWDMRNKFVAAAKADAAASAAAKPASESVPTPSSE